MGLYQHILSGLHIHNDYWLNLTLLPEPWATTRTAAGAASQESNLPEDLSGLPPLRVAVAGQMYHC